MRVLLDTNVLVSYLLTPTAGGSIGAIMEALTEGSFTNIFVERDGKLLTPPARLGLLPGVLRRHLIDSGRAEEAELRLEDLQGGFFIGNALRGLMPAQVLA